MCLKRGRVAPLLDRLRKRNDHSQTRCHVPPLKPIKKRPLSEFLRADRFFPSASEASLPAMFSVHSQMI